MARLWNEGFEFGDLLGASSYSGATVISTVTSNFPATVRSGWYYGWFDSSTEYIRFEISDKDELYLRAAFNQSYRSSGTTPGGLVAFYNGDTRLDRLTLDNSGNLALQVGTGTAETSFYTIGQRVWYLLEVYVKIHDTTGVVTVKINGTQVYSFSGDTKPGSETVIDNIRFGYPASSASVYYFAIDDVAINDTSGATDNSWVGDGHIVLMKVDAAGDANTLSNSAGTTDLTTNYTYVDDIPPDGDTTYVWGTTDQYDLYNLTSPTLPTYHVIERVWAEARAKDPETGDISLLLKTLGTMYESTDVTLTTAYGQVIGTIYADNPSTSDTWTSTDLDGLQVGVKIK